MKPAGPSTTDPNASDSAGFDRFQILFHWATLVALLVTIASGLALYYPPVLEPAAMAVGFPIHRNFRLLVDVHVASVVAFALLIAAHIAWDVFKLKGSRLVIPGVSDIRQLVVRVESFVRGGEILRGGKYDVFMKSFHILLTITTIILAVTGATLYLFAPWWLVPQLSHPAIEPWWKPTILHDLFGFSLVVLLTAHTYFALLRVNRPLLRAMFRPRPGVPVKFLNEYQAEPIPKTGVNVPVETTFEITRVPEPRASTCDGSKSWKGGEILPISTQGFSAILVNPNLGVGFSRVEAFSRRDSRGWQPYRLKCPRRDSSTDCHFWHRSSPAFLCYRGRLGFCVTRRERDKR